MTPRVSCRSGSSSGNDVLDRAAAPLALDEVVDHAHGAGAIERVERGEVFDGVGLVAAENVAHAAGFELEDAGGEGAVEDLLVGLGVVERDDARGRGRSPRLDLMSLRQSSMTVSVVRPRKSIFSRPIFSTAFMS